MPIQPKNLRSVDSIFQSRFRSKSNGSKASSTWTTYDKMFLLSKSCSFQQPNVKECWSWQVGENAPEALKQATRTKDNVVLPRRFETRTESLQFLYALFSETIASTGTMPDRALQKLSKTRFVFDRTPIQIRGCSGNWKISLQERCAKQWILENHNQILVTKHPTVKDALNKLMQIFENASIENLQSVENANGPYHLAGSKHFYKNWYDWIYKV